MLGIICPPPVGIGLTDLPNIGGASGPPVPPSSGTTEEYNKVSILGVVAKNTRNQSDLKESAIKFVS